MHYSNLRNDERETSEANTSRNISVSSEDILKKKESYWFLALVVFLVLAGSIIFYCAHTGVSVSQPASASFSFITEAPKTSSAPQRLKIKLHTDEQFEYYKVAVSNGTRLTEGKVSETCEAVGMKAVCSGPDQSCKYNYPGKCVETPLSKNCNNPMYPLSKILCNGKKPRNCDQLEGVFSFMNNWYGGECGRVKEDWCANGDDFVAGTTQAGPGRTMELETYFGYCAKEL